MRAHRLSRMLLPAAGVLAATPVLAHDEPGGHHPTGFGEWLVHAITSPVHLGTALAVGVLAAGLVAIGTRVARGRAARRRTTRRV